MQKNFELLFTALALITIELANEEVAIDLIRLSIALQVFSPMLISFSSCMNPKATSQKQLLFDF